MQKDDSFTQGTQQKQSFKELVHILTSTPVLQMPLFDNPFIVHIDASNVAIGAVLTQKVNDMVMPVYYYSKRLNDTEARQSIHEHELYAKIQALGKWRCYLVNRHTVVYSDQKLLQYFIL